MSMNWFRASISLPKRSEKYLACHKGIYYLANYDSKASVFHLESEDGQKVIGASEPDLFWASLELSSSSYSILVVDDDPDDRNEIISIVKQIKPGISILQATSSTEAISHFSSPHKEGQLPSVILLDLYLPEIDGFHVLKTVRTRADLERTKVYVISSSYSKEDWSRARDLGANAIIHKNNVKIELARYLSLHVEPGRLVRND